MKSGDEVSMIPINKGIPPKAKQYIGLEKIYVEDFGKTGFDAERQGRKFFLRLFRDDPLIHATEGRNIIERIENAYRLDDRLRYLKNE